MSLSRAGLCAAAVAVAAAAGASAVGAQAPASPGAAAACPVAPDPASLPSAAKLKQMNTFVAKLGARPTGGPAQAAYVAWIRKQLKTVPGLTTADLPFRINRWTARKTALQLTIAGRTRTLAVAGPVPYSKPTGRRGVKAPLAFVPTGTAIDTANASGKIVVREAPAGSVQQALFLLPVVSWMPPYDPNNTIDPSANFKGDFIAYLDRIADLKAAAAAGAKGIVFVKPLPRRQIKGHYEPYEGLAWGTPGVFLGADQGKAITDAITAGKGHPSARITVRAGFKHVTTPTVLATLPGESPQRIVIDSHTDGTNAVEDNGPVAMVAMARYFALLPEACRPRTLEFAFSTAHFYQRVKSPDTRDGAAEQLAQQLDADYDKGTVSAVVVLEHLGAIDYEEVARKSGPGMRLQANGLRAIQFIGVTPSPSLVNAVDGVVQSYDMQRTILLQGSDAPGDTVPSHCSFGGEGTPYEKHLLPTVGVIAAPQSLYDPAFGLEGIDFGVMHSEVLGYTELLNRMGTMSQPEVSGQVDAERAQRASGTTPSCPSGA